MELFIIVALLSLAVAVQPLAAKRLPPLVHGALGSLCVGVSLALTALFAGGFLATAPVRAALPDIDRPAPVEKATAPSPTPDDESRFFAQPQQPSDIEITTPPDGVIIPAGRPVWVEAAPIREGNVHTSSVSSGLHLSQREAMHALDDQLKVATAEYIGEYLHSDLAPQLIRFSLPEIKQKLLRANNIYDEKIIAPTSPMHQVHARLEFDNDFRELLERKWGELRATYRLAETGLVSGGVLLLIATVFGYFRLDNATRGYYTGRLQFMAAAAILAIVASSVMASRWIHWL